MHCRKPCRMDSKQEGVKYWPELIVCCIDRPFSYHVTSACVRTDPPPHFLFTWLVAYLI
jgi:hypothetical protein